VPEGYVRRTLRLLRDKRATQYTGTKEAPYETIRQTLKKNELKLRRQKEWCIAPGHNAEFAAGTGDAPGVYARERDEKRPSVCTGECPKQLIGETGVPIPAEPGQTACFDMEEVRNGKGSNINWRFTTADARIKLKRLYPSFGS
jgi:hypothetical protein